MTQSHGDSSVEKPPPSGDSLHLVAIGASAGGIRALRSFFEEVPEQTGIAFVVVMHLSPEHDSQLAEVLQPRTRLPVRQVRGRTRLEPDCVYVIPPDRSMKLADGHLELAEFDEPRGRRSPIDIFFRTVAEVHPDGVGVLLSGSGTDGVIGLKAIKELGGIVMAQSPEDADYDTMPRTAISTGVVDFVLPARELGARVVALRSTGVPWPLPGDAEDLEDGDARAMRRILNQLRARTGHDFNGYKKSTMLRRISRRVQVTGTEGLAGYLRQLEGSASEAGALLQDLLISVTRFFRDRASFEVLERDVIPALFRDPEREVRVWVTGCATGEEAYSIAMLLDEHAATLDPPGRFQLFATDLDAEGIALAREGLYPDAVALDIEEERMDRFFTHEGPTVRVKKELRDRILFSVHDLLRDPPFSRLDMVTCRNLLIYLEKGLQDRVLDLFRYALKPGGYVFLGEAESVPDGVGFRVHDREHRIYRRTRTRSDDERRLPDLPLPGGSRRSRPTWPRLVSAEQAAADAELHRRAVEAYAPPSILVDRDGTMVHVSDSANRYLQVPAGSPSASLLKTTRLELRLELRTVLFRVLEQGQVARSRLVALDIDGRPRRVQIHAAPARIASDDTPMALVTFLEAGPDVAADPAEPVGEVRYEETESELVNVRRRLQQMMEASEHRQEELKASNEELQSINEEYKSAVEELETGREELQSVNEELKAVNDELKNKVDELGRANDDLRNLMAATEIATLFLDRELRIKRYTPALRQLFNVLPSDEDRPLHHITHSLNYPELIADCEAVLESLQPTEREVSSDGHAWLARITPYRTRRDEIRGVVCTFTEVTRVRAAQADVRKSEERFRALVEATAEIVWTCAPDGTAVDDSPSWRAFTGQTAGEWLRGGWLNAVHPEDRERAEHNWRNALDTRSILEDEFRLCHGPTGEWRFMTIRAVPLTHRAGEVHEWVAMCSDVTERKRAEQALRQAKAAAEQAANAKGQFLATMSHELRTPLTAVIGISDLLETEVTGPMNDGQKKHLARIKASAWHLVHIIEEVLTYSRAEAGRIQLHRGTVDLAAIAREVMAIVEFTARQKDLKLELQGAGEPLYIHSDAGKIRQIVTNLVGNAVKFTDRGSVTVSLIADNDRVELHVRDTGPGIPEHHRQAVFEPFVQVDSSRTRVKGGSGLGLAVSRHLARLLGGEIELSINPGDGCTFTLRLPAILDAAEESASRESSAESSPA